MIKTKLIGKIAIPGDKAISHRALIFASFCKGTSVVSGMSPAQDCQSTADCMSKLGLQIKISNNDAKKNQTQVDIQSGGLKSLTAPKDILFAGNSGTTMRLMSGLLAGRPFSARVDGDHSLRKRPMSRVLDHLKTMGAQIKYLDAEGCAPFSITGGNLKGMHCNLKIASAQVQTALLLAGLQASGRTTVQLPSIVRDHTPNFFKHIGIPYEMREENTVSVVALEEPIKPFQYVVPGDISSAAFFMVAAACLPGSDLLLPNMGINKGRNLVIGVLKRMGADIELINERELAGEPIADIRVKGVDRLMGTEISGSDIARGVDEIPVLALAGALCDGTFLVKDADELRHKESDRLQLIVANLKAAGAQIEGREDGFVIEGKKSIAGGSTWTTALDHRLAMTGLIANLLFENPVQMEETASTAVSYPGFMEDLQLVMHR